MIIFPSRMIDVQSHLTFITLISPFESFLKIYSKISSLRTLVNIFYETLLKNITKHEKDSKQTAKVSQHPFAVK